MPHCNCLWPSREPRQLKSRLIWNVRINCIIFKLKCVFSAPLLKTYTLNKVHSITYLENNVQSPFRTYPIIAPNEHWAIFHVLELYSTNQIPFCQLRLCSISCHFPVNKLHWITYSNRIVQLHWKELRWNQMLLIVNFSFLLFLLIKFAFIYSGLYLIAC